ncbi:MULTISPECIES: helix-turn-helix domain-containing protein [unclassified Delftia]|uniref:helix-turn-helix domain-containing protein n=1 Tax=unclassified Delftia TaxID=2613839 RepID=UPI001E6301B4|nr:MULTISPECIES: helix-turn-helix transcriptional regulator [unclassified Delftia]MCB4786004.1 helix-turn-helix transcriptional regulator [Delftia sp. Lp-1]MDC2858605.1 helix-turn-helix transcriptional regulator [Delftia sp. DT-2]
MSNVKAIRALLQITQQAFADGIGCTQSNIAQYERGQTEPSPGRARRIVEFARGLGLAISLEHVYGDVELPTCTGEARSVGEASHA